MAIRDRKVFHPNTTSPSPRTTAVAPTRQTAPAPVPKQPMAMGQPRQPGLMGQMAATAGGVAIGSTVGHVIGSAITGGGRSDQPDVTYQEPARREAPATAIPESLSIPVTAVSQLFRDPGRPQHVPGIQRSLERVQALIRSPVTKDDQNRICVL
ncbi:putative coiled-coil-helix-coiled-coil-helix domain-containing protein 2, mitochondrial [Apostichopus japonicus]|uniref:Putative coiled-coil-helix-coiled-coil-helix domain-containing protein 2, mitochondrial n=1 Tax=Stichopus japonicus TaxID=307972 RepID=A0A2G8K944_STIJA|nr:putative coiled-coil-helix-coiled-coil-helix domain-containing protein 2, mitochondrial [Apostichopus japonicus]